MKVYLRTFGCRANHADSETARALIESSGGSVVDCPEEADVALFNSCAVTGDAEADLRQQVRHVARRQPRIRSVVMGCAAALDRHRSGSASLRSLPTVDAVVGGADPMALAEALGVAPAAPPTRRQSATRAVIRVQDGCDEHCTFCVTRIARGGSRSRPVPDIVTEARSLAAFHPEIVLTGIHTASYGDDLGTPLGALVAALLDALPDVRFRLSSLEATRIDSLLVSLLRQRSRGLAPFLHAPLQSGSDRLLRRMGRHWYSSASYVDAVLRVVDGRTTFGLSADILVGFPGETDDDHRATVRLVERLPYTALHVFPYSARPGTPAARLGDPVPPPVRAERARELRTLASDKGAQYRRSRIGGAADVIVVGDAAVRRGVTEDLLTVDLADPLVPRGTRFDARLSATVGGLIAGAADTIVPR
jgi:threonylcarbamoyladenosine tRNA methylthiotransferase MtaB